MFVTSTVKSLQRLGDNPRDYDGQFAGLDDGIAEVSLALRSPRQAAVDIIWTHPRCQPGRSEHPQGCQCR